MLYRKLLWSIPTAAFFLTCYFLLFIRRNENGCTRSVVLYRSILIIYISLLITITLDVDTIWVCIGNNWPFPDIQLFSGNVNLNVFCHGETALMLIENTLLFVPLGILFPLSHTEKARNTCCVLMIGMVTSTFIELVQFVIGRSADICDFLMNSCGTLIGWAVLHGLSEVANKNKEDKQ